MLIYDLVDTQELQGYVRRIQIEEDRNRFVLSEYLPARQVDEIEWRANSGTLRDQDAAVVRSWDTESPIGNRQGISRLMGELPPISKKIRLGEEERLRRRALERSNNQELITALYDDAGNMARAVLARIEMMRGELLFNAKIIINENGVSQTVDFGRTGSHTVTAGTLWSTTSTATPVSDLRTWVSTYIATNGVPPAFILTSTDVVSNLLLNAQIRALATNVAGTPALVTVDTVQAVLTAFGLPPIVTYDVNTRVAGTATRVTPANKLVLMPPANEPLGNTIFGTTAEALELADAQQVSLDQAPGLVSVIEKTFDPVSTWTKAAAVALPIMPNPNLTLTATVQ